MFEAASKLVEFNRPGYATVPSQQAQRTVLSTQQVIKEIETAQHIATASRNADSRDGVAVYSYRRHTAIVPEAGLGRKDSVYGINALLRN
jgi:hypothetical protein